MRVWVKYRSMWSSGPGTWEYSVNWVNEKNIDKNLTEHFAEMSNEYSNVFGNFRGMEWEVIDYPSSDYMLRELERQKYALKQTQIEINHLNDDIRKAIEKEKE